MASNAGLVRLAQRFCVLMDGITKIHAGVMAPNF